MPLFTHFVYEILGVLAVLLVALVVSLALKRLINVMRDVKHVSPLIANRLHAVRRWVIIVLAILVILEALGIFRGAWVLPRHPERLAKAYGGTLVCRTWCLPSDLGHPRALRSGRHQRPE